MATGGSGGSTARFESGSSHANRGKPSGAAAQESSGATVATTATTMSQADLPMSSDGSSRSVTYGLKSDGSADRCLGRDGAAWETSNGGEWRIQRWWSLGGSKTDHGSCRGFAMWATTTTTTCGLLAMTKAA
uniref:Uncharacterized protein n=1 Tax=Oryza barthii TaxID=65489 RepID=A0A0D3HIW1_9ORYZ